MLYINERFELSENYVAAIKNLTPNFGYNGFGELVYYRSYSRMVLDDNGSFLKQENWHDTVLRVINGVFSIRKDWYVRNRIEWDENHWQLYAFEMARSMFKMEWLPPGRGLWAMGTNLIRERGAMALYNCCFVEITNDWIEELCWLMDTLMYGCGVGFKVVRTGLELDTPDRSSDFIIPDSREGWVDAMRHLFLAFVKCGSGVVPVFDYSLIRPEGALIKSFGGIASGPAPLKAMLDKMEDLLYRYATQSEDYDEVAFKTDMANLIGVCVVTGNVRRSAELALCDINDPVFMGLKDYSRHPERAAWGWMSNNSVILDQDSDFEKLDLIAEANINGYDIGYVNYRTLPQGRIGKDDEVRYDIATGLNPCGEIPLEKFEVCNVVETLPTRCVDKDRWLEACEYATFYASTVSLLPTHSERTNRVIARNRRIGVSIIDFTGWTHELGVCGVTAALREGYIKVRGTNKRLADEAGVPESIRVTTMKPGGSTPKLAGKTPGASYPTFDYTLRRIRIQANTTLERLLKDANIPWEPDQYSKNTTVFEYPIYQGPARPATHVTLWEQAMNLVLLQREWADNMVSNTLYFKPRWISQGTYVYRESRSCLGLMVYEWQDEKTKFMLTISEKELSQEWRVENGQIYKFNPQHEENQIEAVLSAIAPLTKSVSLLPHSAQGAFAQMPEQGITKEEYERRLSSIKAIDWSQYKGSDGIDEKYCEGPSCAIPK